MATNYDEVYKGSRNALGVPTKEFVQFFESYEKQRAQVLDLGCGQGRDALFIARLGHCVTGVDQSPAGIRDLLEDANSEGLEIDGVIADICSYTPDRSFDVAVIDRTLHMLDAADRMSVLRRLLMHLSEKAVVLIADERSNLPAFADVFQNSDYRWSLLLSKRGFLFLRREGAKTGRKSGGLE